MPTHDRAPPRPSSGDGRFDLAGVGTDDFEDVSDLSLLVVEDGRCSDVVTWGRPPFPRARIVAAGPARVREESSLDLLVEVTTLALFVDGVRARSVRTGPHDGPAPDEALSRPSS